MTNTTGIATAAWPHTETDQQRLDILAGADRILAGQPARSTGNLSVVQLAIEADVKYWIVAQKHTDLRDHFQSLVARATAPSPSGVSEQRSTTHELQEEITELREQCANLQELVLLYATAAHELAIENRSLRTQAAEQSGTITPLYPR